MNALSAFNSPYPADFTWVAVPEWIVNRTSFSPPDGSSGSGEKAWPWPLAFLCTAASVLCGTMVLAWCITACELDEKKRREAAGQDRRSDVETANSEVEAKRAGHDSAARVNPRKGPEGQKRDKMPPSAVSSTQSDDAAACADHDDDSLSSSLSSLPPTHVGYNSY